MIDEKGVSHETSVVVTEKALRRVERRLKTRLRAYFEPGEKLRINVEEEEDFVYAQLALRKGGDRFRLELEAAIIVQDQEHLFVEATTPRSRLMGAIEFLSERLEQYFKNQRGLRFHVDWRLYPFDSATVRFRGRERRPELEEQATQLLDERGDSPS